MDRHSRVTKKERKKERKGTLCFVLFSCFLVLILGGCGGELFVFALFFFCFCLVLFFVAFGFCCFVVFFVFVFAFIFNTHFQNISGICV